MKKIPNKVVSKWLNEDDYEKVMKYHKIAESDSLMEDDLREIDKQLKSYSLEVYWFENGSGIAWCIKEQGYNWV